MGWVRALTHITGISFSFEQWRGIFNIIDNSLDFEFPADGIPYIKTETAFSDGEHDYTVASSGLVIDEYIGWDSAATAQDETYTLVDTYAIADSSGGEGLLDYMFGATGVAIPYEGTATYESAVVDLDSVGYVNSTNINWTSIEPVETSLIVQSSVYDGIEWSAWTTEASGTTIAGIASSTDLAGYKLKYRVIMEANASNESPSMSELVLTFNSRKQVRFKTDGKIYLSSTVVTGSSETLN